MNLLHTPSALRLVRWVVEPTTYCTYYLTVKHFELPCVRIVLLHDNPLLALTITHSCSSYSMHKALLRLVELQVYKACYLQMLVVNFSMIILNTCWWQGSYGLKMVICSNSTGQSFQCHFTLNHGNQKDKVKELNRHRDMFVVELEARKIYYLVVSKHLYRLFLFQDANSLLGLGLGFHYEVHMSLSHMKEHFFSNLWVC